MLPFHFSLQRKKLRLVLKFSLVKVKLLVKYWRTDVDWRNLLRKKIIA